MALMENNPRFNRVSGKIGKYVIRKLKSGKTVLAAAPGPRRKPATIAQIKFENKFKESTLHAKRACMDPAIKAMYKAVAKPGQSAYNVAVADASRPPYITNIDASVSTKGIRKFVKVDARDDFKVVSVKVSIFNGAGELIEEGEAVEDELYRYWKYKTINHNKIITGSRIVAVAKDIPGNEGTHEMIL